MNFNDKEKGIICVIRHGQTDWNMEGRLQGREEIALNEKGIAQAKDCAEGIFKATEMFGIKWDKVISSPLGRAKTTAEAVAEKLGQTVSCDERLIERNYGVISGFTYKQYENAIYSDDPNIEGLESTENIVARLGDFIKNEAQGGEKILAFTHGGISRVYARSVEKCHTLCQDDIVRIENCHICVYTYDKENVILEGYNIAPKDFYKFIGENIK